MLFEQVYFVEPAHIVEEQRLDWVFGVLFIEVVSVTSFVCVVAAF